jgi:hypothetical protein
MTGVPVELEPSRRAVDATLADARRSGITGISAAEYERGQRGASLTTNDAWTVIFYPPSGFTAFDAVRIASEIQDFIVERVLWMAGESPVWPECPLHPNGHPLDAVEDATLGPAWRCPKDGTIARIGELAT